MRLSIIIPAYNEEKEIGACLRSVREALDAHSSALTAWEIIVTDNASTDRTAEIAREHGATVAVENIRQISRSRNAGAALATGDWLLFVDADSRLRASSLGELLTTLKQDTHVGGGCRIELTDIPWRGRILLATWNLGSRALRIAAGSFLFCRADAFRETGGFSLELFAAEELDLTKKLKRWGRRRGLRFVILRSYHASSGRKFHLYGRWEMAKFLLGALRPRRFRDREKLAFFYDGRR